MKINPLLTHFLCPKNFKKAYRIMKISLFIMFVCVFQLFAAKAEAQNTIIELKSNKLSIEELFKEIEKQTDYLVVYSTSGVRSNFDLSLTKKKAKVSEYLNEALEGHGLKYEFVNNYIILSKAEASHVKQNTKKVEGVVLDQSGEPIIGANVVEKGTMNGIITDMDGKFILDVGMDATLVVSYIGYTTMEVPVSNKQNLSITLKEDTETLEEVVVVGYGTQKKVNLTGAVSQVTSKVLENRPITNLGQGLQGVVPNLNISFDGGDPNAEVKMNIRGLASISGEGSSPLVMVDGVQMNMNMVNPEDVESVSVLKDASSSAIYGARGAFGVILITTKKGKTDRKPVIEYSGSIQLNTHTYLPDMLSAPDYMDAMNESSFNNTGKDKYSAEQVQWVKDYYNDPVNNPVYHMMENGKIFWNSNNNNYKQMLQKWAPTHKHTVNISGGSKAIRFYASAGYMNQEGMFKDATDVFKRYNFLSNISADLTSNFRVGFKAAYTHTVYDAPHAYSTKGTNWWEQMTRGEPQILFPITTPDDSPVGGGIPTEHFYNFLTSGSRNVTNNDLTLLMGNAEWDVIKGLKIKGDFSYRGTNDRQKDVQKEFDYIRDSWTTQNSATFPSSIVAQNSRSNYFAANIYGEYLTSINEKHNITVLAGFNQEWESFRKDYTKQEELVSSDIPSISLGTGKVTTKDEEYSWAIRGMFMRLKYDYMNKYLFEMNGRYDGTSKFPHNSRYGFFPSFSVGWRISSESFMESTQSWLNDLKVRANYGSLGNQNVNGYYPYISTFGVTQQTPFIINGSLPISVAAPGLVSSDLTWETVKSLNLGVDVTVLDRLSASFDWFNRKTINMLTEGDKLPSVLGTDVPRRNNADMKTTGWELSINWRDQLANGFSYDLGLILSDYQSEITKFDNNPSKLYDDYYVGKKIGEIWGYETVGIFQSKEEVVASANQSKLGNGDKWGPGDTHYADLNGDNVIDWGDKTVNNPGDTKVIGNTTPRYQFGITANLAWKGFDCNIFIQGVGKRDFFPIGNYFWGHINNANAVGTYEVYKNAWREDNPGAFYPMWKASSMGYNVRTQTRYLQSGAYARLKNFTIGYTIPTDITRKVRLNKVRIYFSGQNLFEITNMRGNFDPELIGNVDDKNSSSNVGKVGEFYPLQRSILFGLQLSL